MSVCVCVCVCVCECAWCVFLVCVFVCFLFVLRSGLLGLLSRDGASATTAGVMRNVRSAIRKTQQGLQFPEGLGIPKGPLFWSLILSLL